MKSYASAYSYFITYSLRQAESDNSQSNSNHALSTRRAKLPPLNTEASPDSKPCNCNTVPSEEIFPSTTAITIHHHHQAAAADSTTLNDPLYNLRQTANSASESPHKKRNVNWHTPIQIYATFEQNELPSSSIEHNKSNGPATNGARLEPNYRPANRSIGEDDGFESLNNKSSSGEDNNHSPNVNSAPNAGSTTNVVTVPPTHLRLRLNVSSSNNTTADSTDKITHESTSSCAESDECDDADIISSPASAGTQECNTSATDWLGVTTNSEDCSYTSELDQSDGGYSKHQACSDEEMPELDITPTTILNPHSSLDRSELEMIDIMIPQ